MRARLWENTRYFRAGIATCGFTVAAGDHPIIPIMIGDAALAHRMAARLLEKGIYVVGFSYPVVPKGMIILRLIPTAVHTEEDIRLTLDAFSSIAGKLKAGAYKGIPMEVLV